MLSSHGPMVGKNLFVTFHKMRQEVEQVIHILFQIISHQFLRPCFERLVKYIRKCILEVSDFDKDYKSNLRM